MKLLLLLYTLTVYHAISEQTDSTPNITADGSIIQDPMNPPDNWVAVPRDMLEYLNFGDEIEIICDCPYSGCFEVHDVMAPQYTNCKIIDVLIGEWDYIGKWENVEIIIN
jgi:hypothetical protein